MRRDRRNYDHIGLGAYWARNQVSHGRADVLELARGTLDEGSRYDAELPYDLHMPWNASPDHPVVRLVKVAARGPRDKHRHDIQRFYNECVTGRSVIEVCALLQQWEGTPRPDGPA